MAENRAGINLNRRQRLDLAGIFTAGLVSTGLCVAVLQILPRTQPVATAAPARVAPRVTVVQKDVIGTVSVPPVVTVVPAPPVVVAAPISRVARSGLPARPAAKIAERERVASRLARLIAGDGRHTVRPFPSLSPPHR